MSHRVGVWGVMAAVVISGALAGCAETSAELDRLREQASEHVDDVRSQSEGLWEQAQGLSDQVQQAASAASKDASAAADSVSKALDAVEQGMPMLSSRLMRRGARLRRLRPVWRSLHSRRPLRSWLSWRRNGIGWLRYWSS